ncbi:cobalt-zinc-cadmium efflux system outer membrane protein [Rhodopirellula rubra]|uniref:Cobalt-zinc-cadmium efflux system outer membrane protein n=1 Tax=Aporhodopirellula rubra TaxID=980271 RepID=A0A7W5H790_9BACT|nr:TolC family protein [Aporhodopirellula rubra]MBB3208209.1 cobalt-zinc-cadmium efflux system outer membrane protein [Aporhodopirellula rubra]
MKKLLISTTACSVLAMTGCAQLGTYAHFGTKAHKNAATDSIIISETATDAPLISPVSQRQSPAQSHLEDASGSPTALMQKPDMRLAVPIIETVDYTDDGAFGINLPSDPNSDSKPSLKQRLQTTFAPKETAASRDDEAYESSTNVNTNGETFVIEPFSIPPIVSADCPESFDFNGIAYGETQQTYTLADVEQLALGNHPAIAAASATHSKAAGLRAQVGTRPNPTLGYFGQQMADRNTDQHGIFVEQEFVRGNKLKLNREVLGHTTRAQAMETETQRHRVLTDVRVRFFEALAAQQSLEATRRFSLVAKRGVEVAEDRERAEEGTLIETLQAQTLLSEIQLAAEQAEFAYQGAWRDLAAIAGIHATTPANLVAELNPSGVAPDWESTYASIFSQSPELSVARAIVCEKQALLRRQQVQYIPNITGQLGAGYDVGTDNGMINLQVTAPIPVWNKNQGNISAAYADYVRATQEVKRIEQSIRSRLARTAQEFESALAAVRKYEDEILPQAQKSLDLSEEAYRAGELEFLQVLIVRRSFYEASIRLIDAKGRLAGASAKVDGLLLTGGLDSPTDYTDGDGIRGASFGGQ